MDREFRTCKWIGINQSGHSAAFITDADETRDYRRWLKQFPRIPKPELPAVMVRIPDVGQPSVFLHERGQRQKAPTSESREVLGATPPESPVEYRAPVAFAEPSVAEPLVADEMGQVPGDLFRKLESLPPPERPKFLIQYLSPLLVARKLEPENPERKETQHDWSI